MKIALLLPGGVGRDGITQAIPCLHWLIERLASDGHAVHVFVPRQEERPGSWPLLGATVHNAGWRPAAPWMLAAIIAEQRKAPFDVIHAFWSVPGATGTIAAKLLRVPMVLTLPGGDVARLRGINYGALLSLRGRMYLRFATHGALRVTTPSHFMKELAAAVGIAAEVVPLGVDLARWPPAPSRLRDPANPLKLLHVANLNRVKDQATLLEAAALLRAGGVAFELLVIGFDTLAGEVQRFAERLQLGAVVRFLGAMPHDALRPWFDWADLLVVTSRHEAGPLVMLEAAVAGVPTVGTRVGHLADQAPAAALAVEPGNACAVADAIHALAEDEGRRLRIAAAAQAFAVRHDADFTARAFAGIYGELSGQRASRLP